jgi:hypothetical protein
MQFSVPEGDYRIAIELPPHWSESVGFWLSATMGVFIFVAIVVEAVMHRRRH